MKTAELSGVLLDYWVARAEGGKVKFSDDGSFAIKSGGRFEPSTRWAHGGPVIERECIHLEKFPGGDEYPEWLAFEQSDGWGEPPEDSPRRQYGDTALIAAMRAYVASKFGAEVPDDVGGI